MLSESESGEISRELADLGKVLNAGISRTLAIATFCRAFRIRGRPEHWLDAKAAQFRALLRDPITANQACALAAAVRGEVLTRDLLIWLRDPAISWNDFNARRLAKEAVERAKGLQLLRETQDEHSARVKFGAHAKACDSCGTPACDLEWRWERYAGGQGRFRSLIAGWKTYCRACAKDVDFIVVVRS